MRRVQDSRDSQMNSPQTDLQSLREFIYHNPELDRLEGILDNFNIFRALGIVDYELRHSRFLAWLLDPQENHGLSDHFLKSFLKAITYKAESFPVIDSDAVTLFDIDSWSLEDAEVLHEWRNIDILIKSDAHRFLCLIENKLWSTEHDDQLERYRRIVESEFGEFRRLFVYLTVEGDRPSDGDYLTLTHKDVVELIEVQLLRREKQLGPDVATFMTHYAQAIDSANLSTDLC